jgi:protein-S-isoprenylcysteine O-methyltransferase Ste14
LPHTPLFLTLFFIAYLAAAFVWPSVRTYKQTGINPLVLGRSDDAYDYIGRGFKLVMALVPVVIACAWMPEVYEWLVPIPFLQRPAVQYVGAALCILSLVWTVIAQAQMGLSWRIGIDKERRTDLVQSGVFRLSRNPIFLGMILTLVGFFALLPNAVSLAILTSGYLLIQIQIRLEEAHLAQSHGAAYLEYRRTVRRFL